MQENKNITAYRQMLRERILEKAMNAFARKGIKAVKMDDIAGHLAISKRTLYEIYDNKEVLLYEGVKKYKSQKDAELQQMMSECSNVMDIILRLYQQKVEEFKMTNPLFYADIEKYPRVLEFLDKDKEASHQLFLNILLRGKKEGYFRVDLDYELVSLQFSVMTHYVMTHQLYSEYSLEHIMYNIILVMLRGFCTQKGIEILDEFMQKHYGLKYNL